MKKRIIVTAAITACLALWGAVWPQAETVGEPPASPQTPAVSAPEPIVAEVKLETEIDFQQRKKRLRLHSRSLPMKPPMSRSLHQWKRLQLPTHDQRLHQSLLRNLFLHSPRYRRSLARSPAIWSMWKASVGWSTKGQITANTARTFTKTATKSASWVDLKNCAA